MKHIKTFESFVNESKDSPAIRNAVDNYNKKLGGYNSMKKLRDLQDTLARTIIDNVVGNGPVHYDSSKDNVKSVIDTLEDYTDDKGRINYDENLIYASTYMLESVAPVSEGVGKGHPDIVRVMREIEEWDADMMENLLSDIATNYKIQAPELDNMDAIGIYKHLMEAVKLLKKRTGN